MVSIAPSNRGGSYADPLLVEEAMGLLALGYSSTQIERQTGIPARTVRDWANSPVLAAKYGEAIRAARERIAFRMGQVVQDKIDKVEAGEEEISLGQAFVGWGIATDKVQRDTQSSTIVNVAVQVLNAAREMETKTIEAKRTDPAA